MIKIKTKNTAFRHRHAEMFILKSVYIHDASLALPTVCTEVEACLGIWFNFDESPCLGDSSNIKNTLSECLGRCSMRGDSRSGLCHYLGISAGQEDWRTDGLLV